MTSTPCNTKPLMIAPTAFSLPGMVREEKITLSPRLSVISGWSSLAMRDSAALGGLDELGDGSGNLGFRGRAAVAHGVGGIADQGEQALIAQLAQPLFVSRAADDRGRIDLPVAGVQHRADFGVNRQRMRLRN